MFETIKNILIEEFAIDADIITESARLDTDLGISSLDLAELAFRCESEFGVEIKDEDIATLLTVGDIANYIDDNRQ